MKKYIIILALLSTTMTSIIFSATRIERGEWLSIKNYIETCETPLSKGLQKTLMSFYYPLDGFNPYDVQELIELTQHPVLAALITRVTLNQKTVLQFNCMSWCGLRHMKLANCGIRSLESHFAASFPTLESLDLSENDEIKIPEECFPAKTIRELYLQRCFNKKQFLYNFSYMENLEILDLSHNSLYFILPRYLPTKNLAELRLRNCGLASLPADVKHMDRLSTLYLQDNPKLTFSATELPASLKFLFVRGCKISLEELKTIQEYLPDCIIEGLGSIFETKKAFSQKK